MLAKLAHTLLWQRIIMRLFSFVTLSFALLTAACGAEVLDGGNPAPQTPEVSQPAALITWGAHPFGCGDIYVYLSDSSETKYLSIRGSRADLALAKVGDKGSLDLAKPATDSLGVSVDVYPRAGGDLRYCNDYIEANTPSKSEEWAATGGRIEIELVADKGLRDFDVTITLKGVTVKRSDGTEVAIPDAKYENLHVGWLAG